MDQRPRSVEEDVYEDDIEVYKVEPSLKFYEIGLPRDNLHFRLHSHQKK